MSESIRQDPSPVVVQWLQDHESDVVVTPIVLGEIEYGILQIPLGRQPTILHQWFREGIRILRELDLDTGTATA